MIEQPSGRADDDLHTALEREELPLDRLPAVDRQHGDAPVTAVAVHCFSDLHRKLAGRRHDQRLHRGRLGVEPLDERQREGGGLAGAGRGAAQYVAPAQEQRNGVDLDRRRLFVAQLFEHAQYFRAQSERFEAGVGGVVCHIKRVAISAPQKRLIARELVRAPAGRGRSASCARRFLQAVWRRSHCRSSP